jgi:serine phosphatase RsbU (regulator of sigma subunit)
MFKTFQAKLSAALIGLSCGGLLLITGLIMVTAVRNIREHYEGMAHSAAAISARYAGYLTHQQDAPSPSDYQELAELLVRELMLDQALFLDSDKQTVAEAGTMPAAGLPHDALLDEAANAAAPNSLTTFPDAGNGMWIISNLHGPREQVAGALLMHFPMREHKRLEKAAVFYMGILAVFVAGVAVLCGWVLSRRLARPVHTLILGARQFSVGALEHRIHVRGNDEFTQLADEFNHMAASLSDHIERLHQEARWRERVESELRIAQELQQSLLPTALPERQGLQLAAVSLPAREVGGDFYDVLTLGPHKTGILIGDAADKGLPAALMTAECLSIIRTLARDVHNPAELLCRTNAIWCERVQDSFRFVTLFLLVIDTELGLAEYASAGHNPPFLLEHDSGNLRALNKGKGLPLGVQRSEKYISHQIAIKSGDTIFLYTDGLTEAQDREATLFGAERLGKSLVARQRTSPEDMLRHVRQALEAHVHEDGLNDDTTFVVVRYVQENQSKR